MWTEGPANVSQLNVDLVLDSRPLALSCSHLVPAGGILYLGGWLLCRPLRHGEVKSSCDRTGQQLFEMLVVWLILVAQSFHIKEECGHLIWKTGTVNVKQQSPRFKSQCFNNNGSSQVNQTAWENVSSVAQAIIGHWFDVMNPVILS